MDNGGVRAEYRVGQIDPATTLTNHEVGLFACVSMNAGVRKRRKQ